MNRKLFLVLSILTVIAFLGFFSGPISAQEATATPRPTFGPTCTPTLPPTATPTPTLPITAGSPTLTSLALALGGLLLLGSLGVILFQPTRK